MTAKENLLKILYERLIQILPAPQRVEYEPGGIALTRYDAATTPENCLYWPMIALIVAGQKRAFYGEREITYGKGQYVVLCSDMPGAYHITEANTEQPFLSISLKLDPGIIRSLLADQHFHREPRPGEDASICKGNASEDLLLSFYRLLQLADAAASDSFLRNMVIREIHYFVLNSSLGEKILLFSLPGTRDNRIARSIGLLRKRFREQINMGELARQVNMAPSTFNKYFRQVTSLSPLQFQKRLRLQEAQRLLLMENADARTAAFSVGYESESQFSREYKRHFGQPPIKNITNNPAGK